MDDAIVRTEHVSIEAHRGLVTGFRSYHFRCGLELPEYLEVFAGNQWEPCAIIASQVSLDKTDSVEDFITGNEKGNLPGPFVVCVQHWQSGAIRFRRDLLVCSSAYNDCWAIFRFRAEGAGPLRIRWTAPMVHPTLAWHGKRSAAYEFVPTVPDVSVTSEWIRNHRLYIGKELPQQELYIYCDYRNPSICARLNTRGFEVEFVIDTDDPTTPIALFYEVAGSPLSDSLFLVEKPNWTAALAAITCQTSGPNRRQTGLEHSWMLPFTPFLWFDRQEGIQHYQRLLLELPHLQSIFVFGQISHSDYRLLKHILKRKERLPPVFDATESRWKMPSKIFLIFEDDERESYLQYVQQMVHNEVAWRQTDHIVAGVPAYVPRTQPFPIIREKSRILQYKRILESWFYGAEVNNIVCFSIPDDPIIAAVVAPLARYYRASIVIRGMHEDGPASGVRKVFYVEPSKGAPATRSDQTSDSNSMVVKIRYSDSAELTARLSLRLQNLKMLDLFIAFTTWGNQPGFCAAMEAAMSDVERQAVMRLRAEKSNSGQISFESREAAVDSFSENLLTRVLRRMPSIDLLYYLSPVNEPRLTPHVILSGSGFGDDFFNLFSAANYSSAKLAPLLLINSPQENSIALQFAADVARSGGLNASFEDRSTEADKGPLLSGSDVRDTIGAIIRNTGEQLAVLFPEATLCALESLSPAYVTLIPGNNSIPYELARLPVQKYAGRIAWEVGPLGKADDLGRLSLIYRLGRLTGDTDENTCRMICHVCITSHVYRGRETRIGLVTNPTNDLPAAETESRRLTNFASRIAQEIDLPLVLMQSSGNESTTARFREICNSSVDFMHFAGHGSSSIMDPYESILRLSDGILTPLELANDLVLSRNPVVFLNACEAGRMPGFLPTALFRAFAGNVVGTMWPVFDESAALFSTVFLSWLLGGTAIGAAMQQAKAETALCEARSSANEVSAAAYVLYGDPLAVPFLAHFSAGCALVELARNEITHAVRSKPSEST